MARFEDNISANIVALAIEKSLLEFGVPILHKVEEKLRIEYKIGFVDCIKVPNAIANVLYEIFGTSYIEITNSIERNMREINLDEKSKEFLKVMYSVSR